MPGPKMGPRPPDFNEGVIKQSPTFAKWEALPENGKLRYACREFIKGRPNDEERLMRRIMIARRNNIRDHEVLKKARLIKHVKPMVPLTLPATTVLPEEVAAAAVLPEEVAAAEEPTAAAATKQRARRPANTMTDAVVATEMDVAAVEKTRSYRAWVALEDGKEFVVRGGRVE